MTADLSIQTSEKLPHWRVIDGKLHRVFELSDFIQAFDFMSQVAVVADLMNHHPEWSNIYKTVVIDLITHSEGQVTQLDTQLAQKIDSIYDSITG